MVNRARAAVLLVATLALAACGNIHPGDAAVVDGRSISMSTFDKTARIYCELTLISAAEQGVTSVPNADIRRQTISDLVTIHVARDLAKEAGVTPDKQSYELSADQLQQIASEFPKGDDAETVELAIENSQEIAVIATALAEKATGTVATQDNATQMAEAGQAAIVEAFKDHDVEFAPRFGLSDTMEDLGPTGSLSAANIDFEAPADDELPAAQRCT